MTCFTLYNNVLLNSVLITLNGTHAVVKVQVKKHYCSSEIFIYILDVSLWCGVRMHLTVTKLACFCQFPNESAGVACFVHELSNLPYLPYLPYPTLQFSEEWVRGRKLMACITP